MNLNEIYNQAVAKGAINEDPAQRKALMHFEDLRQQLAKPKYFFRPRQTIQGIYIWGSVGTGKTFLMDMFFKEAPVVEKKRFHFHQFMQQVDAQLRRLQGTKNPLQIIAADLAKEASLLCFDEFLVEDVADAMILAELLLALFAHKVVLVATSNTKPDDLYLKGLQRARFLPAIAAIKSHCQIVEIVEQRDYRLGRAIHIQTWLYPLNAETQSTMLKQFSHIEKNSQSNGTITIQNRTIPYILCGQKTIWFDFNVICNTPRSQLDYLEIAQRFTTIFVSNIPAFKEQDSIYIVMLRNFVDVMYDAGIRLIFAAETSLDQLYAPDLIASFQRTYSRLEEMQSEDYLARVK